MHSFFQFWLLSAAILGFPTVIIGWRYGKKHRHYRILYLVYLIVMAYLLLITMAYDFNTVTFDPSLLGAFWDPPTFMVTAISSLVLAHLCMGKSLPASISLTLSRSSDSELSWWLYFASVIFQAFVFSTIMLVREIAEGSALRQVVSYFGFSMVPALLLLTLLLPLPFFQKEKGDLRDPWK